MTNARARRSLKITLTLVLFLAGGLFVAAASIIPDRALALEFEIDNQSGVAPTNVWVTVAGDSFDVPGVSNNVPIQLSDIPNQELTINQLVSGRVYISYENPVTLQVPFSSPTRFDWAELTVTPNSSDVANLTAVDQFGIGMRLDTYNGSENQLEWIGSANANTIFQAMKQIPGGAAAVINDNNGSPLRVLSPLHSSYPLLDEYVSSMIGKQISMNTAFFANPFTTSSYTGNFSATGGGSGTLTLTGLTDPGGAAASPLSFPIDQIINDIYTGGNTPNTLSGAIYRDVLAGFSTGLWGGKYGNSALSFCSNPTTTAQGSWCPNGFNQPAFGDARNEQETFATCEQYAAVINKYSDSYGNPYSDASKKVTVSIDQPGSGGDVAKLKLTVLPDSGSAAPANSGSADCGAATPAPPPPPSKTRVFIGLGKRALLEGQNSRVGAVRCSRACGQVTVVVRGGGRVLGRVSRSSRSARAGLFLRLNRVGTRFFKKRSRARVSVRVSVKPAATAATLKRGSVLLIKKR